MSLPEAPIPMDTVISNPPSTPESGQVACHDPLQSTAQNLGLMKAELLKARDDRDAADPQLLYSELRCAAEAQIIKNLQRDVEDLQRIYKSRYEEYRHENTKLQSGCEERDRQISKLQEDSRIAHELVASYKRLTEMYEGQQQQQSSYNMGQGWPLLPQYPGQSHSSPFYLPPIRGFGIDPANLRPLDDFNYSIGSPVDTCDADVVMSASFVGFENPAPSPPIQPGQHPTSAERNAPGLACIPAEEEKGLEGGGARKKRKTKVTVG